MSDTIMAETEDLIKSGTMDVTTESGVCMFINARLQFLNVEFDCTTQESHIFVFIVLVWIGILLF
jgi:hypothetical protein